MRHLVLYEPDASGHRMVFVRYILDAAARAGGIRVTLVTSQRAAAIDWVAAMRTGSEHWLSFHLAEDAVPVGSLRYLPTKFARQAAHARTLRRVVARIGVDDPVDHVLIPFLDDYCLFPFAWTRRPFGSIRWSGLAVRPRFHLAGAGAMVPRRKEDAIEAMAYRRMLDHQTLGTLFSIDPLFASAFDTRVRTVGDPGDIAAEEPGHGWLPVGDDAVVILAYGHIDRRKAVDRLLASAADSRMPASLTVALVGEQAAGMDMILDGPDARMLQAAGRLIRVARRVSDAEEAAAFARADIIWGYYPGNYCSSGAMVRAGQMARPLLTTREGLAGFLTRESGSGLTAPENDAHAVTHQLERLAHDAALRASLGAAGFRRFAADTGAAFGDRIIAGLSLGERPAGRA